MKLEGTKNYINFEGATININAISDTHGHLENCDMMHKLALKKDVFEREGTGKQNYFIIGGDWFMSGEIKGFLTHPDKPLIWYQKELLNKWISEIKKEHPSTKVYFIPGNHDLDCGTSLFSKTMRNFDGKIISTNLDFENSPAVQTLAEEGQIVSYKIDFIQDDIDKTKKHPVLNVGIMPVNLRYYTDAKGINLTDNNTNVSKANLSNFHFEETLKKTRKIIDEFKEKYPSGIVILTSHTGANFADTCAKSGNVDLAFDAHEHKDETRVVGSTQIIALSQNFKKMVNVKIKLDEKGNKRGVEIKELRPDFNQAEETGEIGKFYKKLFEKDTEKIYTLKTTSPEIEDLNTEHIRSRNNYLANFVCDAILEEIQEKDPSVQIFAINASAVRGGFKVGEKPSCSMFDVLNCLNGISRSNGDILVNKITGKELAYLVKDNFDFNEKCPESNPLTHYSGIRINKEEFMKESKMTDDISSLCKFITLEETGEVIDPDKSYKIANPEKYFIKSKDETIRSMKDYATPIGLNVRDILPNYFKKHKRITFTPKVRF